MKKSKHFRKDVIIARLIFLCLCAILVAGIVWLVSKFTESSNPGDSEGQSSQQGGLLDSESELESDSESGTEETSEIESETDSETEKDSTNPSESETQAPVKRYVQVTSRSNLNLRAEPNTTSTVLTSLPTGAKAELIEEVNGWYKVSYRGKVGYLKATYAKLVEE